MFYKELGNIKIVIIDGKSTNMVMIANGFEVYFVFSKKTSCKLKFFRLLR